MKTSPHNFALRNLNHRICQALETVRELQASRHRCCHSTGNELGSEYSTTLVHRIDGQVQLIMQAAEDLTAALSVPAIKFDAQAIMLHVGRCLDYPAGHEDAAAQHEVQQMTLDEIFGCLEGNSGSTVEPLCIAPEMWQNAGAIINALIHAIAEVLRAIQSRTTVAS